MAGEEFPIDIDMEAPFPNEEFPQGITVSEFDYSIENHFKAVDTLSTLCGETGDFDSDEIQRLSSSVEFFREWKQFRYPSRTLRFVSQDESKDFVGAVTLPQFSSAAVPKKSVEVISELRKDFVMHVGGLVSALDWCPRIHNCPPNSEFRTEFIAVAAHPPQSSYHKIGAPVVGLGMVQIWCLPTSNRKKTLAAPNPKKRKQTSEPKRPLGRPRKHPVDVNKNSAEPPRPRGRPRKHPVDSNNNSSKQLQSQPRRMKTSNHDEHSEDITMLANFADSIGCSSLSNDVAMPRLMFGLAHNGKVVWDLKWRPSSACDQHRMGSLAVLLGNGALEVWEVPLPRAVNSIYPDSQQDTTDPRFIKLQPVFRCSTIKCGDRQSIPLTLEWSSPAPHDKILVGCHDGVVALWKFCASDSLQETRPLLCFSADTVPIRALSWSPLIESSSEGSNVVVTGSLKGLKFWDLHDPFSPLWVLIPFQQIIYSLDWLPDPRCIVVAFEDGALRILSLCNNANDVPVTGEPCVSTQKKGYQSLHCSRFSIWSVHVSRLTGMVAYCGADGNTLYFQLTTKAVEINSYRYRTPHFLCGTLMEEEESTITMLTPIHNVTFPMKKTERFDVQPLSLNYDSECEVELGTNEKPKTSTSKRKINSKKKAKEDEPPLLLSPEDEIQNKDVGGDKQAPLSIGKMANNVADKKFESLPPKMIALHKVRWNVNVGCENWLCYGGAAGILRCQEMDTF